MYDLLQCRLCAEFKKADNLIHINNETAKNLNLEYKIKESLNLNFQDPNLPKNVCLSCCDKVGIVFEFQVQVRKAQEILQGSIADETKVRVKEELSSFDDQPLDYVQTLLNENNSNDSNEDDCIKKEENCSENYVDSCDEPLKTRVKLKDVQTKRRGKKKIIRREPKLKKERKWPQKRKRNLSDPEEAIDRAERSEIIRRVKDEWKLYKWKCSICKEELPSVDDLRTHFSNVHSRNPQYTCMDCSKVYNSYYSFKKHNRTHRQEYNYRCNICSRFFYLKKQYEAHLEKHDPNKQIENKYVCAICGKDYKSSTSLKAHINTQHTTKQKLYKCETCNRILNSKGNLSYHKTIHKGNRDYTCEQCGKNFLKAESLKYHMVSAHSDEKPYCCSHCQRTFKFERLLKVHLQCHSDKKYGCEVCGRQFNRKATLKRHSSIHTGILAFACEFCEKKFRTKQLLKVHTRQHTGERPYSCAECNHFFTDSANYIKHMRGKHGSYTPKKNVTYRTDPPPVQSQPMNEQFSQSVQQQITEIRDPNLISQTIHSNIDIKL